MAAGTLEDIMNTEKSITGQYIKGVRTISVPKERRKGEGKYISIKGAKRK